MQISVIIRALLTYYILIFIKDFVKSTTDQTYLSSTQLATKPQTSQDLTSGFTTTSFGIKPETDLNTFSITKLSLFTLDDTDSTKIMENDNTKFDLYQSDHVDKYKLKDHSKCVRVEYDQVLVWQFDGTLNKEYPISVYVNSLTKTIIVFLKDDTLYARKFVDNQWKSVFSEKPLGIELDIRNTSNTNKFYYYEDYFTNTRTYIARRNYAFELVKKLDTVVWKANEEAEYATKVEIIGVGSETKYVILYQLDGKTKVLLKTKNKPWSNYKGKIPVELDIGFKRSDQFADYSMDESSNTATYIPKNCYAFCSLKQCKNTLNYTGSDKLIWEAKSMKEFATKVSVGGVGSRTKNVTVYMVNGRTMFFAKDEKNPWTQHQDKIPLELDIGYKQSDHCVEYSFDYITNTGIYTPKFNHVFRLVKTWKPGIFSGYDNIIWEAKNPTQYAYKVVVDGFGFTTKHLRIHMINGEIKHFAKDRNKAWTEYKGKFPVELDIRKIWSTNKFDYYFDYVTNTLIYTAKAKYAFSLVKQWKFLINCIGQHVVIWKAKNKNEYAYRVVVFNVGSKPIFVKVYLINGQTKLFGEDKNIPWIEFKGRIPIEIYIGYKQSDEYLNFYSDYFTSTSTYIPKPNYLFSEIKQWKRSGIFSGKDIVIWKAKNKTEFATKVVVKGIDSKCKDLTIFLVNGETRVFTKDENVSWREYKGKIPVELNLNSKKFNRFRDYYIDYYTDIGTYIPKPNYLFSEIKQWKRSGIFSGKDIVIWKAKNKTEYANKVVVCGVGFKTKFLKVYLLKGQTKIFVKDRDSPWTEFKGRIPIELDIRTIYTTNQFLYYFDTTRRISTYQAKCCFAFSLVKQSKLLLTRNSLVIWKANDKNEYATKVVVRGVGFKKKSVTITLLNGQTKVFAKDKYMTWHEVGYPEHRKPQKPLVPTPVKQTKPSTPLLPLTEDTTQPSLQYPSDFPDVVEEPYVPDSLPPTPLLLPSPLPDSSKPDYSVTPEPPSPSSPGITYIEIDISKKSSTNEYEYKKHGDNHVFTAKPGIYFKKVMDGSIQRWESDGTKYAVILRAREGKDGFFRLGVNTVKIEDQLSPAHYETQPSSQKITVPSPSFTRRPSLNSLDSDVSLFDDDGTIEQVESIMIHHNLRLTGEFSSLASPRFEYELDSEFEDDGTFPLLLSQIDYMQQPLPQVPSQLHNTPLHTYHFQPPTVLVTC